MRKRNFHSDVLMTYRYAIIALILGICACEKESVQSRTVATVGSKHISVTDLGLRLLQTPGLSEASSAAKLQTATFVLESLVDDCLLYLEAQKRGISVSDAEVEHHLRRQRGLLGWTDFKGFQRKSLIDDAHIKEQYREQLTILALLKNLNEKGQFFCENLPEIRSETHCTKKENFLLALRAKYRIEVNGMNIPLALRVLGEHAS